MNSLMALKKQECHQLNTKSQNSLFNLNHSLLLSTLSLFPPLDSSSSSASCLGGGGGRERTKSQTQSKQNQDCCSKRTIYSLQSPLADHSSWTIKLDRDHPGRMHLFSPLTPSQFKLLPSNFPKSFNLFNIGVKELGEEYILQCINFKLMASSIGEAGNLYRKKVAVLNNCGGDFVLLTIHVSGKLVVYKSGDEKWKVIDDLPSPYDDVILREGKFYAVDNTGRVVLVNYMDLNVSPVVSSIFSGDKKFLVDSDGELLLVDSGIPKTRGVDD